MAPGKTQNEEAAKVIYNVMVRAGQLGPPPSEKWIEHGNSFAQDMARDAAGQLPVLRLYRTVEGGDHALHDAAIAVVRWFDQWSGKTANQDAALEALKTALSGRAS